MPILARPPRILSETDRATGTLPVAIRGGPALAARVGGLPGVAVVAEAAEAAVLIAEAPVPEAEAPVLVLAEGPAALTALRLGARGVVSPDAAPAMLEAALRAVARGLSVLPPPALVGLTGRAVAEPPGALTPREREVLDLLAAGASNKAIAHALGLSFHTVKAHVAVVLEKLGARSRADAVARAVRAGLVPL